MIPEVKDILFPSDNHYDIPVLRLDRQAGCLELPFAPYGTGRKNRQASTIHFYVDDYRFNAIWKNPAKIVAAQVKAVVEPNYSLFDTTPLAFGLQFIYQKRWLARWWQEQGIAVYVDLNVSGKFFDYNCLGIPGGWNAFATRGSHGGLQLLEAKYEIARQISGLDVPNLIVYGGGEAVHEFCCRRSLLYVHDFMTSKKP